MNLLRLLASMIASLALFISNHSAPVTSNANGDLAANPTSAIVQMITPDPSQTQLPSPGPTDSGCPQEGHIKSPGSFNKANITFDNQTAGDLKVYWIDFLGKRKFYSNLKAHTKYDQGTWIGHVWVVTDGADQCVKLHSANAVEQILVIN